MFDIELAKATADYRMEVETGQVEEELPEQEPAQEDDELSEGADAS